MKGSKPVDTTSPDPTHKESIPQDHTLIDSTHSVPNTSTCERQYSFKGPSNVISVQLFCMDEQYEARYSNGTVHMTVGNVYYSILILHVGNLLLSTNTLCAVTRYT